MIMLNGKNVVLRAWREPDVEALAELRNDRVLQSQLMTQPRPNSLPRVRRWLQDKSEKEDGLFFVIAAARDDAPLGYVQIQNLQQRHGRGELGICLAPRAHGKGVAQEALTLLEAYLVDTFGLRKLTLQVLLENARAIRFYERYGFQRVGVMKEHFILNGDYKDVLVMEKRS